MANVQVFKVTTMPTTWVVNSVYWVKNGSDVKCYVTDSTGTPFVVGAPTDGLQATATAGNNYSGFLDLGVSGTTPNTRIGNGSRILQYGQYAGWTAINLLSYGYDSTYGDYVDLNVPGYGANSAFLKLSSATNGAYILEGQVATREWVNTSAGFIKYGGVYYNNVDASSLTGSQHGFFNGTLGLATGDTAGGFISAANYNNLPLLQMYGTYYEGGLTDGSSFYFRNKNANATTPGDGWLPWNRVLTDKRDLPKLVQGSNATRTNDVSSFNDVLPTGVYNYSGGAATGSATGNFEVMLRMRHVNETNHYAADIVATMGAGGEYIGWRQVANGTQGAWRKILTEIDTNLYIQNQGSAQQTGNIWIGGNIRATKFIDNASGFTITSGGSSYLGFFTDYTLGAALPIKAGSLVLSNTYSTVAPSNGLAVVGQSWLIGGTYTNVIYPYSGTNIIIGATGNTVTVNGALWGVGNVYTNGLYAYSGSAITIGAVGTVVTLPGTTVLSGITGTLLKTDATGKVAPAVAGVDYATPASMPTLDSGVYTPTVSNATSGINATPGKFTYMRIGNIVKVSGAISFSNTTTGALSLMLTLPIASNLGSSDDLHGVVSGISIGGTPANNWVYGDAGNDKAYVNITSTTTTPRIYCEFSYQII